MSARSKRKLRDSADELGPMKPVGLVGRLRRPRARRGGGLSPYVIARMRGLRPSFSSPGARALHLFGNVGSERDHPFGKEFRHCFPEQRRATEDCQVCE